MTLLGGELSMHVSPSMEYLILSCVCVCDNAIQYILHIKSHDGKEFMIRAPDEKTRTDPINNKWKNHFYEMKGDVGMSLHEKERNKKMPTPRHKVTHNPIPTSLFCFNMLFVCLFVMNALGKANSTTS